MKIAGNVLERNAYTDGTYLDKNPNWFVEESPFKVRHIARMMERNHLHPRTICEVGCGAGEVLRLLQQKMDVNCRFCGYEISPQAFDMCEARANSRLEFKLADISQDESALFDLMLVLDVVEHVEDYFGFLHKIRPKSVLKIFHFPLDLSAQAIVRQRGLLKRRDLYGHIQYFTKETALATLEDVGYELVDHFYTPRCIEMGTEAIQRLARLPRRVCFALNPDLTVRVLGGYSLLVLAR
jgi:cyclopropane fatty-acyl-phospholipid synthase-like methyltransferase